jgi:sugar phosphate isomerase/epimerase
MMKVAAFADEISPDLDEQIRVCKANGVSHFELRGVAGKNVLDFDEPLKKEIKSKLAANGMGVVSIGSPIGKVAIDQPWEKHFDRFKIAVEMAQFFNSPFIRLFSYYPAGGEGKGSTDPIADEVISRFRKKVDYIKNMNVVLVHENEKGIYGEGVQHCRYLIDSVNSPKLRTAFDFANFVQAGEKPIDNWRILKPSTVHIHIKDAIMGSGKVVPAGQGDGDIEAILRDAQASGYDGFLSLEPHLKVAAHSHGETGPELFKTAADALKAVCKKAGVPLAGI